VGRGRRQGRRRRRTRKRCRNVETVGSIACAQWPRAARHGAQTFSARSARAARPYRPASPRDASA
jgi:hypothetical protein